MDTEMKIVETRKQFKALQDNLNVHPFVVTDETVADGLAASVWTIQGIAGHSSPDSLKY